MLSMQKGFSVIKFHRNMFAKGMGKLVLAIRKWMMLTTGQCDQGLN